MSNVSLRVPMELLREIFKEWSFIKINIDSGKLVETNVMVSNSQN